MQDIKEVYDYADYLVTQRGFYDVDVVPIRKILDEKWYRFISPMSFFREYVWVVFCSGFRFKVVAEKWHDIMKAMHTFDLTEMRNESYENIMRRCPIKNGTKIRSILQAASIISDKYLDEMKDYNTEQIYRHMLKLPYIGKITAWHLMRNIGVDCYKPDRHIQRLAELLDTDPDTMFKTIKDAKRVKHIGVADVVLWRACIILGSADALVQALEQ